jgi:hypothetical protein
MVCLMFPIIIQACISNLTLTENQILYNKMALAALQLTGFRYKLVLSPSSTI